MLCASPVATRANGSAASAAPAEYSIEGRVVRLPVEVRDATSTFATFIVPTSAARRFVPAGGLEPAELWPGRSLASLAAVEYRDNDLGRYHEMTVAFVVRRAGAASWPLVGL